MKRSNFNLRFSVSLLLILFIASSNFDILADIARDNSTSFLFFKKKNKKNKKKGTVTVDLDSAATATPYSQILAGSKKSEGLFNVLQNGKNYYYEIPVSMLGRDLLMVNKLIKVPAELNVTGINRGMNYDTRLIRMEYDRSAGKLLVRKVNPMPEYDADHKIGTSVEQNYISSLFASFDIAGVSSDSTSLIIKVNDIYNGKEKTFNDVFTNLNLDTSPIPALSRIISVSAYRDNVHAISELTTRVSEGGAPLYVTVEVGSSIVALPENPMTPRYTSPRVGFFHEHNIHYSDTQQRVANRNYITRWRLEPKEEDVENYLAGNLVEPKKPIVFYMDRSTPDQWRPYIKQGIEEWQRAFEKAGFRNAIQARELPDTIDAALDDMSYSVLNYAASKTSNAMGPSITDPRSGEIIEADIMWWHNVIDILHDWIILQTGAVNPDVRQPEIPEHIMGDAIRFVAAHEVGHSLGLRHNMIASACIPTDKLRDPEYLGQYNTISASIMDYARFNYVAQPGDNVSTTAPHIGPYDIMAIEYGYRWFPGDNADKDYIELLSWLENYKDDMYRFQEAQDSREAVDPRALSEDLGDDPIKSARYGMDNLRRIVPHIIEWTTDNTPGQDYDDASRLYYSAISQWNRHLYHVLANIGGIYTDNTTVGDGKQTYHFVDADRQREALKFIIDEAIIHPGWLFDADVSNYTFLVSNTPVGRIEHAPSYILKNTQSYLLWDLLSDNRIIRMYENEAMDSNTSFHPSEMLDMLHNAIFATTESGKIPNVKQRSMQKNFVDALMIAASENQGVKDGTKRAFDEPLYGLEANHLPCRLHEYAAAGERTSGRRTLNFYGSQANRVSDAISVKRGALIRIRGLLLKARHVSDVDARYHYEDLIMRINTALGINQMSYH